MLQKIKSGSVSVAFARRNCSGSARDYVPWYRVLEFRICKGYKSFARQGLKGYRFYGGGGGGGKV